MDSTSWHSYTKVYALGHRAIKEIFNEPVLIEEKVDGSQFSFGVFDGELKCRSRGKVQNPLYPDKMFLQGVEMAQRLAPDLVDGYTYRGEYLSKPKHNSLAYDRAPENHVIIWDINTGHEDYMSYDEKKREAARLGLEVVPLLYQGGVHEVEKLKDLLDTVSVLGGQKIEGFVVKNYTRFTPDGKAMIGKFVSESFKEVHGGEWRKNNPAKGDVLDGIVERYKTPTRWDKAVQHLKEAGSYEGSPKDIGALIKDVQADIKAECSDEIKDILFAWAWPQIQRRVIGGLPEWYKTKLMESSFE